MMAAKGRHGGGDGERRRQEKARIRDQQRAVRRVRRQDRRKTARRIAHRTAGRVPRSVDGAAVLLIGVGAAFTLVVLLLLGKL